MTDSSNRPLQFAMTGAAGYIAPRHMKAIKDLGGELVAALDPFDSIGILDSYSPEAEFFTQTEEFEKFLHDQRRSGKGIGYLSICSPNYLHDPHIRMAMRVGADAICEKPIVLSLEDIDMLKALEEEMGQRVWTILQLRVHPALVALKERLDAEFAAQGEGQTEKKEVQLSYVTGRGNWYMRSWKNRVEQSGGLATNIGVHFFDMLVWFFGDMQRLEVHQRTETLVSGYLELERARVRWMLSIDTSYIPEELAAKGQRTYRSITVNGEEIEFSGGFTDLHTAVYERTIAGNGFSLDDTRPAIEIVSQIREKALDAASEDTVHPLLRQGS